jgi:hypothetical protein
MLERSPLWNNCPLSCDIVSVMKTLESCIDKTHDAHLPYENSKAQVEREATLGLYINVGREGQIGV